MPHFPISLTLCGNGNIYRRTKNILCKKYSQTTRLTLHYRKNYVQRIPLCNFMELEVQESVALLITLLLIKITMKLELHPSYLTM